MLIDQVLIWLAVGLTTLGLVVMTAAVYGMLWMPGLYTRLHAASKVAYLGVIPVVIAVALLGGWTWASRAVLISIFLLLTTTVACHAIVKAAYRHGEDGEAPPGVDKRYPRATGASAPRPGGDPR